MSLDEKGLSLAISQKNYEKKNSGSEYDFIIICDSNVKIRLTTHYTVYSTSFWSVRVQRESANAIAMHLFT